MDMRNMQDMRGMNAMGDGRNPYGAEGGYVMNARGGGRGGRGRGRSNRVGRGRDRGMPYPMYDMRYNMRGDMRRDMNYGAYPTNESFRANTGMDMARGGMDGHHYPQAQGGSTYYPIQAMGTFEGYYGMPNQDHARGDRGDYRGGDMAGYDMRGGVIRNDYGYPMMHHQPYYPPYDYGYPVGDFGEVLSEQELEEWKYKLMSQLDEQEKQMFSKEMISQKAKQLGRPMENFGEKELCVATLMVYTDYKQDIGKNLDLAVKLAYDWLADKDVAVKGAEKLARYFDNIVMGEDD